MRLSYIHTKKDKRILRLNGLKIGKRASLELSIIRNLPGICASSCIIEQIILNQR